MYRQNSLVKIEEDNTSFFSLWKDWWRSKGLRLSNERKTFEFILPNCSFTKSSYQFYRNQNEIVFDLYDRKIILDTCGYANLLELSFLDFSRKYQENDFISLKIKNEIFILKIVKVNSKWKTIFGPPTITTIVCENKFINV